MNPPNPSRGEVWYVSLDPTVGREQSGKRPALILSVNDFNQSRAQLVIALPITSKAKGVVHHVPVRSPEGGLTQDSFVKCEDIRSISKIRLLERIGIVSDTTMNSVQD